MNSIKSLYFLVADRLALIFAPSVERACSSLEHTRDALVCAEQAAQDKAIAAEQRAAKEVQKAIGLRQQASRARRVSARINDLLD